MTKKKVEWISKTTNLNEIYQPSNMRFSFVNIINNKLYQCHQWVKCRDYLHDVIRSTLTDKDSNIYGFIFTKNDIKPDLNNIRLLVAQPEQPTSKWFELRRTLTRSLKYIHHFESIINEGYSKIEKVKGIEGTKHVWMFTGPKFWLSTPYFVSLYTFLIRLGTKNITKKINTENIFEGLPDTLSHDDNYLKKIKNYVLKLIEHRYDIENYKDGFAESYYTNLSISSFHNYMGIVSLCSNQTPLENLNTNFKKYILNEGN